MLERPHRHRPRLVELAGEEQRAGQGGQSSGEDLLRTRLGERDRTPPVDHRPPDAAVDRERSHQPGRRLDIGDSFRSLPAGRVGDLQQSAPLDRAPADQDRGRRGPHRQFRMLGDPVVRQRPQSSAVNAPRTATPCRNASCSSSNVARTSLLR
jgi:hypothetical protein